MNGTYEGWKNRETWSLNCHVEHTFEFYRKRKDMFKFISLREADKCVTPKDVEVFFHAHFPNGIPTMDFAKRHYENVDWKELAESWQEDFKETFPVKS